MERSCRGCKQPLAPSDTSFVADGLPYCCAGCAHATGCTCLSGAITAPTAPERPYAFRLDRAIPLEAHLNDWLS